MIQRGQGSFGTWIWSRILQKKTLQLQFFPTSRHPNLVVVVLYHLEITTQTHKPQLLLLQHSLTFDV